jgi:hypothetical protein
MMAVKEEAQQILMGLDELVVRTSTQREVFMYAAGEAIALACCKDSINDREEDGTSLEEFLYEEMDNQLGQQIQQWAEEQRGDSRIDGKIRIGALATARV